jgi:hypothetical protein
MKREYDFRGGKRGPVVSVSKRKTRITIRLDEEILAWFRFQVNLAGGGSYQTLVNEALRQHIQRTNHWRKHSAASSAKNSEQPAECALPCSPRTATR